MHGESCKRGMDKSLLHSTKSSSPGELWVISGLASDMSFYIMYLLRFGLILKENPRVCYYFYLVKKEKHLF